MSLSIFVDFQEIVHKHLMASHALTSKLKGILSSLQIYNKYPHLYHKIVTVQSINTSFCATYEIEGEMNLYVRDVGAPETKQILDLLEQSINNLTKNLMPFKFISAKTSGIECINSGDEITSRIKMQYFCLIQAQEAS